MRKAVRTKRAGEAGEMLYDTIDEISAICSDSAMTHHMAGDSCCG